MQSQSKYLLPRISYHHQDPTDNNATEYLLLHSLAAALTVNLIEIHSNTTDMMQSMKGGTTSAAERGHQLMEIQIKNEELMETRLMKGLTLMSNIIIIRNLTQAQSQSDWEKWMLKNVLLSVNERRLI